MRRSRGVVRSGRAAAPISLGLAAALATGCSGIMQDDAPATPSPVPAQVTPTDDGLPPQLGDPYTKQDVVAMYREHQGLRLKLPVTMPEGYTFVGFLPPDLRKTRTGRQVVARKAWFSLGEETVTVCAELVRVGSEICPETNIGVSSTENGQRQQVSVELALPYDTEVWGGVTYSDDPADWEWMPPGKS